MELPGLSEGGPQYLFTGLGMRFLAVMQNNFEVSLLCAGACHVFSPASLAANPEFKTCQHLISEFQFLQSPV